jgi:alkanesulfonate monooxygenase SsuD/methylene tetrahydromethanopterin reductase-like flavin-dependent oxidoreductase (luciferase family)
MKGLAGGRLTFKGEFYNFENVPMEMEPLQKPHPPLWYGANNPQSAERCGLRGMHTVANAPASVVRGMGEAYWPAAAKSGMRAPLLGMNRHIVIDENARARARDRAARLSPLVCELHEALARTQSCRRSASIIRKKSTASSTTVSPPSARPAEVRATLEAQLAESGANYLGCRFAFGDLTLEESLRSLDLFITTRTTG